MGKTWLILLFLAFGLMVLDWILIGESFPNKQNFNATQHLLETKMGDVLDDQGRLKEEGYLSRHRRTYNPGPPQEGIRHKKWDYYSVFTGKGEFFSVAVANLGILSNVFITYKIGAEIITEEKLIFSGVTLSNQPTEGNIVLEVGNWQVNVTNYDNFRKRIYVYNNTPQDVIKFDAVFTTHDTQESMTALLPFNEDGSQYFFNQKFYNYKVMGQMILKGQRIDLNNELGVMDWGRGIWPYKTYWIWGSADGRIGQTEYAINLGYNMQKENVNFSEDALIVNTRLIKLATMECTFDENDLMKPWNYTSTTQTPTKDYAVGSIVFTPETSFQKHTNFFLVKSFLDQIFGSFSGEITEADGKVHRFSGIPGFSERHRARW